MYRWPIAVDPWRLTFEESLKLFELDAHTGMYETDIAYFLEHSDGFHKWASEMLDQKYKYARVITLPQGL